MRMDMGFKLGLSVFLVTLVTGLNAADGCGGAFNETTGTIHLNASSIDTKCIWSITTATEGQVTLHFKSLTLGTSNLTILAGNESSSPQIVQYNNFSGSVTVISHALTTQVVFNRGDGDKSASFDVDFDTEKCNVKFEANQGVVNSPVYRANSGDVKCSYDIALTDNVDVPIISFSTWKLTDKSSLNVTFDGTVKTVENSNDVLGPAGVKNIQLSMQIKNGTLQQFQAVYQTADKACSGVFTTNTNGTVGVITLPKTNAFPIQCYAQIMSATKTKQILVSKAGQGSAVSGGDSVLFLDGGSQKASVIGSLSSNAPFFVSSSNVMTVVASLGTKTARDTVLQYKEDAFSKLYSLNDSKTSASINLDGSKVNGKNVYIQVQSPTMVKVAFGTGNSLAGTNATVTVHDINANVLFVFSKETVLFPVNTPVGGSLIIVQGLSGSQNTNLNMTVSQSVSTDCYKLFQGSSGTINYQLNNKTAAVGCSAVVSTGQQKLATILKLQGATLCPGSKVEIYEGTGPNAAKLGTISGSDTGSNLPQLQFPAGSQPRLVWSNVDISCNNQNLMARYWSVNSVCSTLGSGLTGSVQTPNFPNQYPLNTMCTWPIPAQNSTLLYLVANTIQFGSGHFVVLKENNTKTLTTYSGTTLPNDMIFPNDKLSLTFSSKTRNSSILEVPGSGASLTYKVLKCGGHVTNASVQISNPVSQSAVECIWIIEVPAKGPEKDSVNIVSANISVSGYDPSTTILEIRDGGSVRDPIVPVDLKASKIPTILSRFNFLWIRYVAPAPSNAAKSFNFTLKFLVYNCSKDHQCNNGVCLHPDWRCDGIDQCRDDTDERNCNGTRPIPTTPPPPKPAPHGDGKKGVAAYWIVICLIIGLVLGVALVYFIPKILRHARLRKYQSFNNTENA